MLVKGNLTTHLSYIALHHFSGIRLNENAGRCSHHLIALIFSYVLQVKTTSLWRMFLFSSLDVTVFQHWVSLQSPALSSLPIPDLHRQILVKIFFVFQFMQYPLFSNLIWILPYAIHQGLEERER